MRKKWRLEIYRYSLMLCTPWFALILSSGDRDFIRDVRWWGIKFFYSPDWNAEPQYRIFRKEDTFLSRIAKQSLETSR